MKKLSILITLLLSLILVSSCTRNMYYPNMVEYTHEEVLEIAKEKYNIESYSFSEYELFKTRYAEDNFHISEIDMINPDNLEVAFNSFAGKNGPDMDKRYSNFASYVAVGTTYDGQNLFIYYNVNLDKDAVIYDTIGKSDYYLDILPSEITEEVLCDIENIELKQAIKEEYILTDPDRFNFYNGKITLNDRFGAGYAEFYKEEGKIKYDIYNHYISNEIVFSTSSKYKAVYSKDGENFEKYFDISYNIQYASNPEQVVITINVKLKKEEYNIKYFQFYSNFYLIDKNSENKDRIGNRRINRDQDDETYVLIQFKSAMPFESYEDISVVLSNYYIIYEK